MNNIFKFKGLFVFILGIISAYSVQGQTDNPLTQFTQMPYLYNPSTAGIENYTDIKVGFKRQWGQADNTPKSFLAGVNHVFTKASKGHKLRTYDINPSFMKPVKFGVSGHIIKENVSSYQDLEAGLSGSVHIPTTKKTYLSFGINAGYNRASINSSDIRVRDMTDAYYRELVGSNGGLNYLTLDPGLTFYSQNAFIGYATSRLFRTRLNSQFETQEKTSIRHTAMAGANFWLDNTWEFAPAVLVRYDPVLPVVVNLNAKLRYQSFLWGGVGFSPKEAISGTIGVNNISNLSFSYTFDKSIGESNTYKFGNNHEIMLGILFYKKKNYTTPKPPLTVDNKRTLFW